MYEYLIITGLNSPVNPGNNAFFNTPVHWLVMVSARPFKIKGVTFCIDRFVFRTNGEAPAVHNIYAFLN